METTIIWNSSDTLNAAQKFDFRFVGPIVYWWNQSEMQQYFMQQHVYTWSGMCVYFIRVAYQCRLLLTIVRAVTWRTRLFDLADKKSHTHIPYTMTATTIVTFSVYLCSCEQTMTDAIRFAHTNVAKRCITPRNMYVTRHAHQCYLCHFCGSIDIAPRTRTPIVNGSRHILANVYISGTFAALWHLRNAKR